MNPEAERIKDLIRATRNRDDLAAVRDQEAGAMAALGKTPDGAVMVIQIKNLAQYMQRVVWPAQRQEADEQKRRSM